MLSTLLNLIFVAVVFAVVSLAGRRCLKLLHLSSFSIAGVAAGWALVSYLMLLFGYLHWYHWSFLPWLLLLVFGLLALWEIGAGWRASITWRPQLPKLSMTAWLGWAVVVVSLGLTLLAAMAPATGWDANTYHLAIPKVLLRSGGLTFLPTINASLFQLFPQMQYLFLMWLGNAHAAQVLPVFYLITLLLLCYRFGQMVFGRASANSRHLVWLLATIPAFWFAAYETLVDVQAVFYFVLALVGIWLYLKAQHPKYLLALSVGLGIAIGSKVTNGIWLLLVPGVIWFIQRSPSWRERYRQVVCFTLLAALVALPWYWQGLLLKGNPIWPFYTNIITTPRLLVVGVVVLVLTTVGYLILPWFEARRTAGKRWLRVLIALLVVMLGVVLLPQLVDIVFAPIWMTFMPGKFGGDTPRIGPLLLALLPLVCIPLANKQWCQFRRVLLFSFMGFWVVWLSSFQLNDTRHAMVIFPGLLLLALMAMEEWFRVNPKQLILRQGFAYLIILGMLYNFAILVKTVWPRLPVVLGRQTEAAYLSDLTEPLQPGVIKMPEYAVYAYSNLDLPAKAKVLLLGEFGWYYLNVDFQNGRPDQQSEIVYSQFATATQLNSYLHSQGIGYLITYTDGRQAFGIPVVKQLLATAQLLFSQQQVGLYALPN